MKHGMSHRFRSSGSPLFCVIAALALLISTQAVASGGGAGVRGGGHVVDVDGTPELLDFVKSAVCERHTGHELIRLHPTLIDTLQKISVIDWYFANELRTEIEFLDYCFTGRLAPRSPNDAGTSAIRSRVRQAAIRSGGAVYLDQAIYDSLDEYRQSFLIIHEAVHSYLSMFTPERKIKLRSMVNTLAKVQSGEITTRRTLHDHMTKNDILFPQTVVKLTPYREQVEYLTSSVDSRRAIILRTPSPERLVTPDSHAFSQWLAPWDVPTGPTLQILESDLRAILLDGTSAEFRTILNEKQFFKISIDLLALSILDDLTKEKRDAVLRSDALASLAERALAWLKDASISQGEYRILASTEFQALAGTAPAVNSRPLSELLPRRGDRSENALPTPLTALARLASFLIQTNEEGALSRIFIENPRFYDAMGLQAQFAALNQMNPFVAAEKSVAIRAAEDIRDGLMKAWLAEVSRNLDPIRFADFERKISNR